MNIEDMNQDSGEDEINMPIYNQNPYQNNGDLNSGT